MREIQIFPVFTGNGRRNLILAFLILAMLALSGSLGCGIKKQTKVAVPQKILQAKTATLDELLEIVNNYDSITDLTCSSIRVTLTLGKLESELIEKYKRIGGYLLLRRPDSVRLVNEY